MDRTVGNCFEREASLAKCTSHWFVKRAPHSRVNVRHTPVSHVRFSALERGAKDTRYLHWCPVDTRIIFLRGRSRSWLWPWTSEEGGCMEVFVLNTRVTWIDQANSEDVGQEPDLSTSSGSDIRELGFQEFRQRLTWIPTFPIANTGVSAKRLGEPRRREIVWTLMVFCRCSSWRHSYARSHLYGEHGSS